MNDNELMTAVREAVADVHSATRVEQIIRRSRAVRARRHIPGAAGALVMVAGTALAVTALLPSAPAAQNHRGALGSGQPGSARLAAWTVAKQANGDIDVTINQLEDPAGLQSTLRADGLPVNVTFSGPSLSPACQPDATSMGVLSAVAQYDTSNGGAFLVIDPSALPSGTGVGIFDEPGSGEPVPSPSPGALTHGKGSEQGSGIVAITLPVPTNGPLAVGLVYASQECTGS